MQFAYGPLRTSPSHTYFYFDFCKLCVGASEPCFFEGARKSKTEKLYKRAREANAYIGAGYSKHTVSKSDPLRGRAETPYIGI